jgi:hypothetical protein
VKGLVDATLFSLQRHHSSAQEEGNEQQSGDAVCPVDMQEGMHEQTEEDDHGLIHAEVRLPCIGHHGLTGERPPDLTLGSCQQRGEEQCQRSDADTQPACFSPMPVHQSKPASQEI